MPWTFHDGLDDGRRFAPAAERNKDAILAAIAPLLPPRGVVLEIGSGTGQHIAHFARALPGLRWQPSDADSLLFDSISLWAAHEDADNVAPAITLDILAQPWPLAAADAVICSNVIHVAPWATTLALFVGAAALLPEGSPLLLYGPFLREGVATAPGNVKFDASLKAHDPAWGLREVGAVAQAAAGFALERIVDMPANNLTLVFRRSRASRAGSPWNPAAT